MADPDQIFMKQALRLAVRGRGQTSPNPMVGAVVVRNDQVVGSGYHEHVGGPHAEVNALRKAGTAATGATLYVTLEPCNHFGRTPPCTEAIFSAGVRRVVVGMMDPNPRVEGGGASLLRHRGLEVDTGTLETPCRQINQAFIKHSTTGLPLVTIKVAATLDGRIATRSGDSRWITNERSRRYVHQLRYASDAILVGIETALHDDPRLTARSRKKPACRQPFRIVLDSRLRLPLESTLVRTAREIPVWVACTTYASETAENALKAAGVSVLRLPDEEGRIPLRDLLHEIGRRGVTSLLVEGGGRVVGSFLDTGLADEFHFFYAPKILADPKGTAMVSGRPRNMMVEAMPAYDLKVRRFGQDVLLTGRCRETIY
jgi:diaminohydroxyphosphoribosylaminopyrimidine deaminase / 5-amino-6-(5-phosphoribosylamino)uracil reductase